MHGFGEGKALRAGLGALVLVISAVPLAASELRGHGGPVRALAVDGQGRVLSGSFDTRAILWDLDTGAAEQVLRLHEGGVNAVAFLPDGRMVTGGQEGRIALWRPGAMEPERVIAAHEGPVTALAVAPDGAAVASSAWDGTARLTRLDGGNLDGAGALVLDGHEGNVNAVAFRADGGIVTAGYDQTLRFWGADGAAAGVLTLPTQLNALAVDGTGTLWVAGADGVLRAFDAAGVAVAEVPLGSAPLIALAVSPDGARLAAGSIAGRLTVVDAAAKAVAFDVAASSAPLWSVAFDAAGASVLAGAADNVVRAWDAATGAPLAGTGEAVADALGDGHGARVFRACAACHTLTPEDGNRAGPTLHGIFGRRIATAEGYDYSPALRAMDIVWTPETVSALFEQGPSLYTPGTKMPEQRITSPEDRAALMEFLDERTR
jgi:cytochrome c